VKRIFSLALALALLLSLLPAASAERGRAQAEALSAPDPRYFPETGFSIGNDAFWDYFQKRGALRTFGYPTSRVFTLLGKQVQFYQRRVVELRPDGTVGQLNLLDPDVLPYNTINYATLPPYDAALVAQAPVPSNPAYGQLILNFDRTMAPDLWEGLAVNFYRTFLDTVKLGEAFPNGGGSSGLLQGIDFEMWGVVTSKPMYDPNNHNFVYLRWQRGIMHYDKTNGLTQGLLLGDALKALITGTNLPGDLDQQARASRFYRQYNNSLPNGVARPGELPNTDMKDAFEKEASAAPPPPLGQLPPPGLGLRYGMQAHMYLSSGEQLRALDMVTGAGFNWLKQQVRWEYAEPAKGQIDWGGLDDIVNNAAAKGVNPLLSVVTSPSWSRGDRRTDGPPDNYNDFGDFLAALATRYKGKVKAYEVWNEQNFSREWGGGTISAGGYVELLKVAYTRIKQADPQAIVVSGALTPTGVNDPNVAVDDVAFLDQMYQYQGGVFKQYADGVGAHMAGYNNAPEDWVDYHTVSTPGFKEHPSFYFRRIDQLHEVMARYGDSRQLWITEYEWASTPAPVPAGYEWTTHLSEQQVAEFLSRSIQSIKTSRQWVGAIFVWNLNFRVLGDPHVSETAIFGILNPDWSPRIMYAALRDMPK